MADTETLTTVYVSGVHSGPNPSPGVGVARSLRASWPSCRIIAVDYSSQASGLSWPDFDDRVVLPAWSPSTVDANVQFASEALASGDAAWISGLDLETWCLAHQVESPALLAPRPRALRECVKPAARAAEALGLGMPAAISMAHPHSRVHAFCRSAGWDVWVKGPWYEAIRASTWSSVLAAAAQLTSTWGRGDLLFVQAHAEGREESICFAAHCGELLGAVRMRKDAVTAEGKTWAGTITDVDPDVRERLSAWVRAVEFTGGAEVEMVRDREGTPWLLEINPRFPAWIFGATLAGCNLPSALAQASFGRREPCRARASRSFTRVVTEIEVIADRLHGGANG